MTIRILVIIMIFSLDLSCKNGADKTSARFHPGKNDMADINRYIIQKDRERIQSYYERKGLEMKESQTGLWYAVLKEGNGELLTENKKIVFEYDCSLLDGTDCYSSKELGPKEIYLGRSELPSGLNEGLRLLRSGGEGIFILPPFLAYGLIGDGKKIPPRATVVYYIRIAKE